MSDRRSVSAAWLRSLRYPWPSEFGTREAAGWNAAFETIDAAIQAEFSYLPATPPASGDVEAARETLLNGVAAFDFDAYERALDAFEAAIRAESGGLDVDTFRFMGLDRHQLEEAINTAMYHGWRARLAEDADKPRDAE